MRLIKKWFKYGRNSLVRIYNFGINIIQPVRGELVESMRAKREDMFRKIFLMLTLSLSFQNLHPMMAGGANAGLNPNPELNFDKVELGLEVTDYLSESLKIATMGSVAENKLWTIYFLSMINKFLITGKEFWKLDLSNLKKLDEANKYRYRNDEENRVYAAVLLIFFLKELIKSWWSGNIDSLGVFKLITSFGYGISNLDSMPKVKNIVEHNINNPLQKLNREKLIQFSWLSFNKFMPIVIYTFAQLRNSDVGFSRHLFLTIGDEESKRTSSLYRYCSLAAGISEIFRAYRQAKFTKIYLPDTEFKELIQN